MPQIPQPIRDVFDSTRRTVRGLPANKDVTGFTAPAPPSTNGTNLRQASIPPNRVGVPVRNMVRWFVPEVGVVEMYINPQSLDHQLKKHIKQQRTKGGYVLQYWGEELTTLSIQGTTGSSGVEGINVLYDVYRAEQLAFDPYALALASDRAREQSNEVFDQGSGLSDFLDSPANTFVNLIGNAVETGSAQPTRMKPTLASLAFSVEMYYSGWVFRGYFTDFSFNESADRIGLFNYTINFVVTQRRGIRNNFFGWHRSATHGPSNSDPEFGIPHSFTSIGSDQTRASNRPNVETGRSTLELLEDTGTLVAESLLDAGSGVVSAISSIF